MLSERGREPDDRGKRQVIVLPHLHGCAACDHKSDRPVPNRLRQRQEDEFWPPLSNQVRAAVLQIEATREGHRLLLLRRDDSILYRKTAVANSTAIVRAVTVRKGGR